MKSIGFHFSTTFIVVAFIYCVVVNWLTVDWFEAESSTDRTVGLLIGTLPAWPLEKNALFLFVLLCVSGWLVQVSLKKVG